VEAFGISRQLLAEAKKRAQKLGMTKSGYFRYAFARELGYPENEARDIAVFRSPALLRKRAAPEPAADLPVAVRSRKGPTALSVEARRAAAAAGKSPTPEHQRKHARTGKS
jgi:hypothetical protein